MREKTRGKPCLKNWVAPEVEKAVIEMAYEYTAYGQHGWDITIIVAPIKVNVVKEEHRCKLSSIV